MRTSHDRRRFLKLSGAGLAGTALLAGTGTLPQRANGRTATAAHGGEKPNKIIFMVSDGMSMGVPGMAEEFSKMVRGKGTYLASMMQNQQMAHGWFEMFSLSGIVTDSAAASCSWGCGTRLLNGWVNMLPDGSKLEPILRLAKDEGYGTGLVTTATVTHATPAGFAAQIESRGREAEIAEQYPGIVDVVMGGGQRFYSADQRDDGKDLFQVYKDKGYHVARDRDEALKAGEHDKILGIFSDSHVPYTLDQINDDELMKKVPTLAEMTKVALESLDRSSPKGFVIQVEGARIDHAAHANDAAGVIWDQIAFDDAVGVALEYQRRNPDTLVVVTSDHGNARPGMGQYSTAADESFERLAHAKASFWPIRSKIREAANGNGATPPAAVQDVVKELLGIELSREDASYISDMTGDRMPPMYHRSQRNFHGIFNAILSNYNGVSWGCTTHTEEYVVIAAAGAGQDKFKGLIKNTDAFHIMTDFLGIDHKNKTMSREDAMALA